MQGPANRNQMTGKHGDSLWLLDRGGSSVVAGGLWEQR